MTRAKVNPSPAEVRILREMWDGESHTVRELHDRISAQRQIGYTTILKQMQRMEEKGLIERVPSAGRAHAYVAVQRGEEVQRGVVRRMVDSVFGGSVSGLVAQALGDRKISPDEVDEIRRAIELYDKEREGERDESQS